MAEPDVSDILTPEACVICFERLDQRAVALPCKHDQFDFSCIGTWLNQQRVCPLCKSSVTAVKYDLGKPDGGTIFTLPPQDAEPGTSIEPERYYRRLPFRNIHRSYTIASRQRPSESRHRISTRLFRRDRFQFPPAEVEDPAISFRRRVYQDQTYSLRVGSNRISQHQNLIPSSFTSNPAQVSRAKRWIRRELSVFDFLDPASPSYGQENLRVSNAEFLLEYIVSILKSIDIRGSQGQAEALLKDFLGQSYARLFLHELEAFLRSPYERLEDWDAHVQYHEPETIASVDTNSHKP